jgi:pSer/pThr/pTyr-binding forkhead associated (FHA) protein
MVSRKHAELRWDNDRWYLVDLNSSYGTFLDGRRISVPEKLRAGQVVQFGTDGPRIKIVWFETFRDSVTPPAPVHAVDPVNPPASPIPPPVAVPVKPAPKPPPKGPGPKIVFVEQPGRPPLELSGQGISIGRDPACDINFDPKAVMVSRKHAVIRSESGRYILEDNDSFNGTFVNDQRISAPTPLYHGDMLRFGIGGPELEFVSPGDQPPVNAGLAGQRSVAADNLAKAFELADPVHSKTMVFKLDQSGSTPPRPPADRARPPSRARFFDYAAQSEVPM